MYKYRATLDRVVDGDSVYLWVDLGFHTNQRHKFRLAYIDAPEIFSGTTEERAYGYEAKAVVEDYFRAQEGPVEILSIKSGKYDYVVDIRITRDLQGNAIDTTLSQLMLENGLATPYDGGSNLSWEEQKAALIHARLST